MDDSAARKAMTSDRPPIVLKSSEGVIEVKSALERLGGDTELLRQLAEMYLEDVPQLMRELRQAIERNEPDEIARLAHSVSGLSSTFGAQYCCAAAKAIEEAGRRRTLDSVSAQLKQLESEVDRVRETLKESVLN